MANTAVAKQKQNPLVADFAKKFKVDQDEVFDILKSTAFKQRDNQPPVTNEQMIALMIICDQYGLNPFTKEIYAYPDKGSIVPVVGVDGWNRLMNENENMDGIEFVYSPETHTHKGKMVHEWIEAVITRKDRSKPIVVREYFDEVVRNVNFSTPWDSHPKRMHRHKAEIQCARVAFGFSNIYDEDEAQRIIEKDITDESSRVTDDKSETETKKKTIYFADEEVSELKPKVIGFFEKGNSLQKVTAYLQSKGKTLTDDQLEELEIWHDDYKASQATPVDAEVIEETKTKTTKAKPKAEATAETDDFVREMEAADNGNS